jgi:E3 ubiquitin-protein ligase HUWE1
MLPLLETGPGHISKEKFTLFRNPYYITNRIEELSNFCMVNKRIINKMIKQKPNLFVNELEGLIRHMPNLLDFDNKRTYFKKELGKLKRNNLYGDQIQLYIRRDDIFQDSFT